MFNAVVTINQDHPFSSHTTRITCDIVHNVYSRLLVSASTGVLSATEVSRLRPRTSAVTIASAESGPGLRAPALPVLISDPRLAVDVYFLSG